ncbi:protein EDS1L-like [Nymphaea colorata]|nr:protein EDS1L-like [Nymphaea colorata]
MEPDDLQLVKKCRDLAFRAHNSGFHFVKENYFKSHAIFAFRGSSSVDGWFSGDQFSKWKPDPLPTPPPAPAPAYFPSLKVLGSGDDGTLNKAFLERFRESLEQTQLRNEIEARLSSKGFRDKLLCCSNNQADRRTKKKKKIVFTGYSSGGATAILTTIWYLEKHRQDPKSDVLCITFGAPLVGDKIVGHAIRREGWSSCFKNFVLPHDPIPRIHFSPRHELGSDLPAVLQAWINPEGSNSGVSSSAPGTNQSSQNLFNVVVDNTFAIASCDSCVLRSSAGGSSLLEAVNEIVELSPYRPFGSFYFCCSEGKVVKVENHEAVTQILFYSLQLPRSSIGSNDYKTYETKEIVPLDNLQAISLQNDDVNSAPNILDLSMEARLSLIAAEEAEQAKKRNSNRVNGYKDDINQCLSKLETYRHNCDEGIGYYDAFKLQEKNADFEANVTRLQLIGYWEEVREMLRQFDLPDSFEVEEDLVELGTRIRFLVEPIDIANFYRHDKMDAADLYWRDSQARPKYYKYPENWLPHMRRLVPENHPLWKKEWNLDSCFWARVENMCIEIKKKGFDSEKETVVKFEEEVEKWLTEGALSEPELKRPTFQKWWGMLPEEHKNSSCIRHRMVQQAQPANPTVPS